MYPIILAVTPPVHVCSAVTRGVHLAADFIASKAIVRKMDRTSPSGFVALALLSALAFFTSGSGVNAVPEHKQTASRRELQTTSNIVFVESIAGLAIATAQEDAMGLQVK